MNALSYFLARLKEPSSLASLSAMAVAFGANPEKVQTVAGAVSLVVGVAAVLIPEKK